MDGYIGEVREWAGYWIPRGWASCDGQTLSIHDYPAVYSILGTLYGGDGQNNFRLPDLRPTDDHGVKRHGWEIGQMSKMICIAGVYPDRP